MIRISFQEPADAGWAAWRQKCDAEQLLHNQAVQAQLQTDQAAAVSKWPEAKGSVYGAQKEQVYLNKDGPFHGKCAYCEISIYSGFHGDIEHYRPKGAVKDEANRPILIELDGTARNHPGYYWLAYDWKSLLPACDLCNQPSSRRSGGRAIGKRNHFPLMSDFRARKPGEEVFEEPMLLHPIWDEPDEHLGIDETGVFFAKIDPQTQQPSRRGEACIRILGLNERGLPSERKRVYEDVKLLVIDLTGEVQKNPNSEETRSLLERVLRIEAGAEAFSMAARLAIRETLSPLIPLLKLLLGL